MADGVTIPPGAWRHRRALQLVKILALSAGHRLVADQVIELLWPDLPPRAGSANLRKAAFLARRVLGSADAVVLTDGSVCLFGPDEVGTDANRFERAADAALRGADPDQMAHAIECYAGDLLPDDPYEEWAARPRERLRRKYLDLLRHSGSWQRLVEAEPCDEHAHRELVRGWLDRGNRHAALRQYGHCPGIRAPTDGDADAGRRPAVAINDRGLWLGVEQPGTWLVGPTNGCPSMP